MRFNGLSIVHKCPNDYENADVSTSKSIQFYQTHSFH